MHKTFKKYFIPHAENNFRPHALHPARTAFYGFAAVVVKVIVIVFAISVPAQAYLLPDILAAEVKQIIDLTNATRRDQNLPALSVAGALDTSATAKAGDMASGGYFSHTSPSGKTLSSFLRAAHYNYRTAGENLAMGFTDAESVVNAWIKSPTHYANLIDTDFTQIGVGLVPGYYNGAATVYVAEHFGLPVAMPSIPPVTTSTATTTTKVSFASVRTAVLGTKITSGDPEEAVSARARVYWQPVGDRSVKITVAAETTGPITALTAEVNNYRLLLKPTTGGRYRGELTVFESPQELFKTILSPSLIATTRSGETVYGTIDWFNPKIVSPTPIEQYIRAKTLLSPITNLFQISRTFYLVIIIVFTVALLLDIFVEFRRQHFQTIFQTAFMIGLVTFLWWV